MDSAAAIDEHHQIAALIESLTIGAILVDAEFRVIHANRLAAIIMGLEQNVLIGHSLFGLEHRNLHYLQVCEALNRIREYPADEQQVEVDLHVRGRDHNYLLRQNALYEDGGKQIGTLIIFHDVTHLRDKDRALSNLVASLSQRLKSPLTALSLAVDLLKRESGNQKHREIVETIEEEVSRIRDLSEGLVNAVRGESASIPVRSINFDFGHLVSAVVQKFILPAGQKEIRLKSRSDPALDCYGDPPKLSWVISTLISSALSCTPDGGEVAVCALREENRIRLRVSDTGSGIPPDIADVVFERGSQWELESPESGSVGLGLVLAKEIIEAHGGRIFAESSIHGNLFTVDLPLA
jgi:PAS domain S-box-containing protein